MKHLVSSKSLAAAAVALGALAVASSAQARSEVYFTIGVQIPGVHVQSTPVYVQPRLHYPPVPVYHQRHDNDRRHEWHQWHRHGPHGDRDRDGIPNRFDRLPDNPYRR